MVVLISSSLNPDSNRRILAQEERHVLETDGHAATLIDLRRALREGERQRGGTFPDPASDRTFHPMMNLLNDLCFGTAISPSRSMKSPRQPGLPDTERGASRDRKPTV